MAGRPRKPSALKELTGTVHKSSLNPLEPKGTPGFPVAPDSLTAAGKAEWPYVVQLLGDYGTLVIQDVFYVQELAESRGKVLKLRSEVELDGYTYDVISRDGVSYKKANPAVAMLEGAERHYAALLAKGGLTPSDRSRVSIVNRGDDSEFADFLKP